MRFFYCLVIALALAYVAAAQPSTAPVTLSFSYEHVALQPTAAQQEEAIQPRHDIIAAGTNETTRRSHLAPPVVSVHPLLSSHTQLSTINDTSVKGNSTSDGAPAMGMGGMAHNSTKDSMGTMSKENNTKASADSNSNERDKDVDKESGERKEGEREKEESFPDEPANPHNTTHGNRTHINRSQYYMRTHTHAR